jgi:pimeloyl-ACP methyl ester carboxylesterase
MISFRSDSFRSFAKWFPVLASSVLLVACAPIASVDMIAPTTPVAFVVNQSNEELSQARVDMKAADLLAPTDPLAAMAKSESSAMLSLEALKNLSGRRADEALAIYNYSVARLMEETIAAKQSPWDHEVKLAGSNGPLWLSLKCDPKGAYIPGYDRLLATDRMDIGGTYLTERVRIDGIGATFVSAGVGRNEKWAPNHHYYSVTAIITFSGSHGTIQILDPVETTSVDLAGATRPVAADLTAPLALLITETQPQKFGIAALLQTDKFEHAAKLVMAGPYRTNRTPIILIHGLADSPVTWIPMINALNSSPEIRSKYQIWVFRYPSGLPYPLSADLLRESLAEIYAKYPNTPKAIVVGHSMGGLVADMLVRDSNGDQYSTDVLGKPLDQFKIDPDQLKVIKGSLVFKACPYIGKVIFIAVPHRGADMASNPIGRLGASLVSLPVKLVKLGPTLVANATATEGEKVVARFPNSIDTLRPEAKIVVAMNKLPMDPSVTYYSIIGDRGEGDSPNSSDGVVAYRSSHIDNAKSELIVPVWHSYAQRCPQSIAEVKRILLTP